MSEEVTSVLNNVNDLLPKSLSAFREKPEYKLMLETIKEVSPIVELGMQNFNKTQSQFMDNMLTVSHPTILRNMRQILSELNRSKSALREVGLNCAEKEIDIEILKAKIPSEKDQLQVKKLQIQIARIENELKSTLPSIEGAIRKVTSYSEQYQILLNNWKKQSGKETFTEKDFEEEEERYHIMKAFDQALSAARSRDGLIDEGNFIYLSQIGINGSAAQRHVTGFLDAEKQILKAGKEPHVLSDISFLTAMADNYKGCSKILASIKGMNPEISQVATLQVSKEG